MLLSSTKLAASELPTGPFAHIPSHHGNTASYDMYCVSSGKVCQAFPYCESVHLSEMDAFMLATALNAKFHHMDIGVMLNDARRMIRYQDFRLYFPGEFVVRKIAMEEGEVFEVCCNYSENIFCRVTNHTNNSSGSAQATLFCEAMNFFMQRLGHLIEIKASLPETAAVW